MLDIDNIPPALERTYVNLMIGVVGRGLVSASQVDDIVRDECKGFPVGFTLQMVVMPSGPSFTAQIQNDGTLKLLKDYAGKVDLCARFKHMSHAMLVLTFQEGVARAFANDRLYVDGDVSYAIRMVRCLVRMEALILPKVVAEPALKRYPVIGLGEKLNLATRIYGRVVTNLLKGV
jgi:hypothetical protein